MLVAVELNWKTFAEELDDDIRVAMTRSINRVTDRARTRAASAVKEQVLFPATRLNEKIKVVRRASYQDQAAVIRGMDRPTSLANFRQPRSQSPEKKRRGGGVQIQVARDGRRKTIRRGFLINLKNDNLGLAVRTNGGPPAGAYKPREIGKNLYLLYSASVDQVLMAASDGEGVYEEMTPELLDALEAEFVRQIDLLRGGHA